MADRRPAADCRIAIFVLDRRILKVRSGHIHVRFTPQKRTFAGTLGMSALPITDLGGERHATFFATRSAMFFN